MSNVVSFKRDGEYLLRRAAVNRKDGRLLDALKLTRRAVEVEPGNVEAWMNMAQMLCEMGCYEQSNRVLRLMLSVPGAPTDCYFGMGCNYYGLEDMDMAFGAMMSLIANDPASLGRQDVQDVFRDVLQAKLTNRFEERGNRRVDRLCRRAEELLNLGSVDVALTLANRAVDFDGESDDAQRVLAKALMAAGRGDKASRVIAQALSRMDASLQTRLEAIKIFNRSGNTQTAASIASGMIPHEATFGGELFVYLDAACEVKDDETVARLAARVLRTAPFETRILHICAVNRVREKRPVEQAISFWTRALSIDPDDIVSKYYLRLAETGNVPDDMPYDYALPASEAERYRTMLSRAQLYSVEKLDELFADASDMRDGCLWALRSTDRQCVLMAKQLVQLSRDPWARRVNSENMVDVYESSSRSFKGVVVPKISSLDMGLKLVPPRLNRAIKLAYVRVVNLRGVSDIALLYDCLAPILNVKNLPLEKDSRAWAAVLAYTALKSMNVEAELSHVAFWIGCPLRRALRCLKFYDSYRGKV